MRFAYEYSWKEVEDIIRSWKDEGVMVIPLGAIRKEHGEHLPLATDYYQANYYAELLLKHFNTQLPEKKVLIDATVSTNFFPAFVEYPGTLTLQFTTACQLVEEICETWFSQGIHTIYFLNMGISTNRVLKAVKEKLEKKWSEQEQEHQPNQKKNEDNNNIARQPRRIFFTNLREFDALPDIHCKIEEKGTHAGQFETSIMLYLESIGFLRQGTVRMDLACNEDNLEKDPANPGTLTRNPNSPNGVFSKSGTWGNALSATVELGKFFSERMFDYILKEILEILVAQEQ
jgi:creatinine amidohydrolase